MAEDLTPREPDRAPDDAHDASAAPAVEAAPPAVAAVDRPRRASEPRPYRYRFGLAYLVLAVIAGVGVGSTIVLKDREHAPETHWSAWQPVAGGASFPTQIAQHIGRRYRDDAGNQLVAVAASPPKFQISGQEVPISYAAIQVETETGSRDFDLIPAGDDSVMYTFCGRQPRCTVESTRRTDALLRREALELALYTFRYTDGVRSVFVLMPPNLGNDDTTGDDDTLTTLLFRGADFEKVVTRPLAATLDARDTPRGQAISAVEQLTIDRLTRPNVFVYDIRQAPSGDWLMMLAPFNRS